MRKKPSGPSRDRRQRFLIVAAAVLTAWLPIYFQPLSDWVKEYPPPFMAWMKGHATVAVLLLMAATALAVWVSTQPTEESPALDEVVEELARDVAKQWRKEEINRELQSPW